jgi:hypothetical protein
VRRDAFAASHERRTVLVVGAGLGGLVAATVAHERGFGVRLFGQGAIVGEDVRALHAAPELTELLPGSRARTWLRRHGLENAGPRIAEVLGRRLGPVVDLDAAAASIEQAGSSVRVRDTRDGEHRADLALVALSRDSLRRIRWDGPTTAAILDDGFLGTPRRQVEVLTQCDGHPSCVRLWDAAARWLDSLPPDDQHVHAKSLLPRRIASAPELGIDAVRVTSSARRIWPLDLGWLAPDGTDRDRACGRPRPGGPIVFCGSHLSPYDGLGALIGSALAAVERIEVSSSSAEGAG